MTESEAMDYRGYVFKMSDNQLDIETKEAVRQRDPLLIQLCYNDWRRRGQGERFLKAYNLAVQTSPAIDFEFR